MGTLLLFIAGIAVVGGLVFAVIYRRADARSGWRADGAPDSFSSLMWFLPVHSAGHAHTHHHHPHDHHHYGHDCDSGPGGDSGGGSGMSGGDSGGGCGGCGGDGGS